MSKSKKSSKSAKVPQPMKIKKEKSEEDRALHSMAHFVDDRVELVKQIFGSLKNKTITNLAPEYLKGSDMDEIQELCLNELLCLSTKRLLSIINATKCPTDTESSEDSDVEAKEEHISLEEISSGSELENGEKSTKKPATQSRTKKNSKKANPTENKNSGDGQMSVLELLELQARARAIRSQLALEPVTKIEVDLDDNDDDGNKNGNVSSTTKDQKSNRKRKKSSNKEVVKTASASSTSSTVKPQKSTPMQITETEKSSNTTNVQKIKLKRNFRKQTLDVSEADSSEQPDPLKCQKIKKEVKDRSPSPDVIPIEPVPETLCISDSGSDTEKTAKREEKQVEQPSTDKNEEAEDGEIIEDHDQEKVGHNDISKKSDSVEQIKRRSLDDNKKEANTVTILQNEKLHPAEDSIKNDKDIVSSETKNMPDPRNSGALSASDHDNDCDQNDDIISIEGGDLETEMSEHLDEDTTSKCSIKRNFNQDLRTDEHLKENDIISLESSENEDGFGEPDNGESWHARYLKSTKVSKVLAVSRLGKRVRDKLKTSKISKRDATEDHRKDEEPDNFKSKHEEGSVEQYKELLELTTHRKV